MNKVPAVLELTDVPEVLLDVEPLQASEQLMRERLIQLWDAAARGVEQEREAERQAAIRRAQFNLD